MNNPTDTEMLDWLAERCWYPNDHPNDKIAVLIPEQFSKHGSFTCNHENDRKALRAAIQRAMRWQVPDDVRQRIDSVISEVEAETK